MEWIAPVSYELFFKGVQAIDKTYNQNNQYMYTHKNRQMNTLTQI